MLTELLLKEKGRAEDAFSRLELECTLHEGNMERGSQRRLQLQPLKGCEVAEKGSQIALKDGQGNGKGQQLPAAARKIVYG